MRYSKIISLSFSIVSLCLVFLYACKDSQTDPFVFNDVKIIRFSPIEGIAGDTVTIIGENFSNNPDANEVFFNEAKAQVLSANAGQLIVIVPQEATKGRISVRIGKKIAIGEDFNILDKPRPVINNFFPTSGGVGDEVTVQGQFFENDIALNTVTLNGVPCKVLEASLTEIKFEIAAGAGSGKIKVTTNAQTGESRDIFTFIPFPPVISRVNVVRNLSNPSGIIPLDASFEVNEGEVLLIEGQYFNSRNAGNVIRFEAENGGRIGTPAWLSNPNVIVVKIPTGAKTGRISVSVLGQETFFTTFNINIRDNNTWRERRSSPFNPGIDLYQWVLDGKLYILPKTQDLTIGREFWAYDVDNNTWERKADFGRSVVDGAPDQNAAPREFATTFTVQGKLYLVGGQFTTEIDVWEYSPLNNAWKRKQNFAPNGYPAFQFDPTTVYRFYLLNAQGWTMGQGNDQRGYIAFNNNAQGPYETRPRANTFLTTEARRMWLYNPALDIDFNRDENNGDSQAWTEIGSRTTPAVNFLPPASLIQLTSQKVVQVADKVYFLQGLLSTSNNGFPPPGPSVITVREFINQGGPTDTNPTGDSYSSFTVNNIAAILAFSSDDRIYFLESNLCLTPFDPNGIDFYPLGAVSAFHELNPQTRTTIRLANYAGSAIRSTSTGRGLSGRAQESGGSLVGFSTNNKIFIGLGEIIGRQAESELCRVLRVKQEMWEYIP